MAVRAEPKASRTIARVYSEPIPSSTKSSVFRTDIAQLNDWRTLCDFALEWSTPTSLTSIIVRSVQRVNQ